MHVQIVMNSRGDSRHAFNPYDATELDQALGRFKDLTRRGYVAVGFSYPDSKGRVLHQFDSTVPQTLFIPQLRGG